MIKESDELQYLRHVADSISKDRFALAAVRRALNAPLQADDMEALKTPPSAARSAYDRGYDAGYHAGLRAGQRATGAEGSAGTPLSIESK